MFIDDYIEKITLQEEVKNLKSMNETLASEKLELKDQNAKLKTGIDLYRKADAEKADKIKSLSEEIDVLKYSISVLKKNAAECKLRLVENDNESKIKELEAKIETLENDRSEDVETINTLNIKARDLNGTISTLIERVSKSDEENQDLKKKVHQLKDIINNLNKKLYE